MKKSILAIALTTGFLALSRTNGGDAKKGQLDGAWQLISGQPLPKKARDIKIISGGHFFCCLRYGDREAALYRRWNFHSERKLLH
jgi:hypothetical protein